MNAVARKPEPLLALAMESEDLLRSILYGYTCDLAVTSDLLQDLYVKLLHKKLGAVSVPKSYLISMAHNTARDWLRHKQAIWIFPVADLDGFDETEILDSHPSVEESEASEQALRIIVAAINRLTPQQRRMFVLRKVYEFSHDEIAVRTGIAKNTIERHLCMAIRNLANILGSRLT